MRLCRLFSFTIHKHEKNSRTHAVIFYSFELRLLNTVMPCVIVVGGRRRESFDIIRTRVQGRNDDDGPQLFRLRILYSFTTRY